MSRKFYITTPIYYVNAEPHIGTVYTTIAGDVLSRYKRLMGFDVFYLTGTDEHGQKISRAAQEKGLMPQELADQLVPKFKETWRLLNISYDYFIRTTDPKHQVAVQRLFHQIYQRGDLYQAKYQGWYCTPCERYVLKDELPREICPICKRPTEYVQEINFFFRLSKYQSQILEYLEKYPHFIQPESRYNEIKTRVAMGLEDISISRASFDWGIPLPLDPKQVIWVWFDALINYISAIGYPSDYQRFQYLWPADIHLIGKDILWFHTVIWPAMLLSAGLKLPAQVFAHGWWTFDSDKISKSKGNVVYPQQAIEKVGVDGLRYFMMREVPFGLDGDFSYQALINRYNNDLGNDLGNLLMRSLTMIEKYCAGKIPHPGPVTFYDTSLRQAIEKLGGRISEEFNKLQFSVALEAIWEIIKLANKYIEETKPWLLAKEHKENLKSVLYTLVETIRIIGVYLLPFIPQSANTILAQIGSSKVSSLPEATRWGLTLPGSSITKGSPLFPRVG